MAGECAGKDPVRTAGIAIIDAEPMMMSMTVLMPELMGIRDGGESERRRQTECCDRGDKQLAEHWKPPLVLECLLLCPSHARGFIRQTGGGRRVARSEFKSH